MLQFTGGYVHFYHTWGCQRELCGADPPRKKTTCRQVYMGGHGWPIYDPTATYKAPCFSFGVSSGKKNNGGKSKSSRNASVFVLMRLVTKALRLCAASRLVVSTGVFFFPITSSISASLDAKVILSSPWGMKRSGEMPVCLWKGHVKTCGMDWMFNPQNRFV